MPTQHRDNDPVWNEAWRREASHHPGHRNFRPHLRPVGANLIGLRGEQAFAAEFGLAVNLTPMLGGDGHRDLQITLRNEFGERRFVVDCKAAVIPKDLIVKTDECSEGTIYVLCRYWQDKDRCTLLGWQWGGALLRTTPRDYGYGVMNYWLPARLLRPISELKERFIGDA
jgi:hypothetical protein